MKINGHEPADDEEQLVRTLQRVTIDAETAPKALTATTTTSRICIYSVEWAARNNQHTRDLAAHRRTLLPQSTPLPIFRHPNLPVHLQSYLQPNRMFYAATTLAHLLLATHRSGRHANEFDVVTQRGNLNKIALRQERFNLGVQRIGKTLFLRRFLDRACSDSSEIGFQFERACTGAAVTSRENAFRSHLVASETHIDRFRIMIESEIDAVLDSGEIVELKSSTHETLSSKNRNALWLQTVLGGIDRAFVGYRNRQSDRIDSVEELSPLSDLAEDQVKRQYIGRIRATLEFLDNAVTDRNVYLFRRGKEAHDELFRLTPDHAFVDERMLDDL